MRTSIKRTADREVTLRYQSALDGVKTRVFWIPQVDRGSAYVREGDSQVCEYLAHRGETLTALDGADLLRIIRAEWQRAKRLEKMELI